MRVRNYDMQRSLEINTLEPNTLELKMKAGTTPTMGMVIGTYGAIPYIHLHLALRSLLYPELPMLVHDDCSPDSEALRELCQTYEADFCTPHSRVGHYAGDLKAFARGLEWASERRLDFAAKFSRRFVPLYDWRMELANLLRSFSYPTFSSYCTHHDYGFRTECVALSVAGWTSPIENGLSALEHIRAHEDDGNVGLVEAFMHEQARRVCDAFLREEFDICGLNRVLLERVISKEARSHHVDAYGLWPIGGTNRRDSTLRSIWHEHNDAVSRYAQLSNVLGLEYRAEDFVVVKGT
jgi:hypothetical protein